MFTTDGLINTLLLTIIRVDFDIGTGKQKNIGIIHIIATTICCVFFYKKARTKYKIQIGSKLFVFNEIMALLPYLYLMFTWIII